MVNTTSETNEVILLMYCLPFSQCFFLLIFITPLYKNIDCTSAFRGLSCHYIKRLNVLEKALL